MAKKIVDNRFDKVYSQGKINGMEIWKDKETGVHYLYCFNGYGGGLTPLLDEAGNPFIQKL